MRLEKRTWVLATLMIGLLTLVSLRMVYWQLVRGPALQPVALDPIAAAKTYRELGQANPGLGPTPTPEDPTGDALDYLAGGDEGDLQSLPQPVIQRTTELLARIQRGSIYDRSGQLLASDQVDASGSRLRHYEAPSLGHVIGYVSGIRTGITGLELAYNESLLGLDRPDTQLKQMVQLQEPIVGSDLVLTIDLQVQQAAVDALGERTGSVVVLDGHTGAVLALVSRPDFDPNRVLESGYDPCAGQAGCRSPYLNRATQSAYTPGSTWKTVTLMAALDTGQVDENTVFDFGKARNGVYYYEVDGGVIPDPNHKESKLSLAMSYARSANAAFARMGAEMNPETFIEYAGRVGFGAPGTYTFPLEIEQTPSQLANDVETLRTNNLLRAATAIGQGELLATPLNMAMVVLPALNDGNLPLPYFVQAVRSPSGRENRGAQAGEMVRNIIKAKTARLVHDMMITVVEQGGISGARIPGVTVGGKTGTAQLGGDQAPHAWFIGFAEKGDRAVVAAVMVENGNSGALTSAPIFAQVAQAALERLKAANP